MYGFSFGLRLFLMVFLFSKVISLNAQNNNGVQVFDLRGKGFDYALKTARVNSKQNTIFLVIASTDEEFTTFFHKAAQLQYRSGRTRLYVILADKHPAKPENQCILIANDTRITTWVQKAPLSDDDFYSQLGLEISRKIKSIYYEYIE